MLSVFYIVKVGIYELPGELAMVFIVKVADSGVSEHRTYLGVV
jgi:hypothetical protein